MKEHKLRMECLLLQGRNSTKVEEDEIVEVNWKGNMLFCFDWIGWCGIRNILCGRVRGVTFCAKKLYLNINKKSNDSFYHTLFIKGRIDIIQFWK